MPLVAVVTPVYNGAKYLTATMACVQRQTYPNLVHVVLDNASTDGSPAIIRSFAGGKIPILTARNETVLRQVDNWNAAIRMTPPEAVFVQWLCADDLLRRDAIEKLVAKAMTDREIVCVGAADIVHDLVAPTLLDKDRDVESGIDFIARVCQQQDAHFAWQAFFIRWRREWAEGDFFIPGAPSFDCEAALRVMALGKVAFVRDPLIYTRHHAETLGSQMARDQSALQQFWMWEAALKHGAKMSPGKARAAQRVSRRFISRYALWFRAIGARQAEEALQARATMLGAPLTHFDYLQAGFGCPWDFLRTRWMRLLARGGRLQRITEEEFAAF